jgi:hypothetical protein
MQKDFVSVLSNLENKYKGWFNNSDAGIKLNKKFQRTKGDIHLSIFLNGVSRRILRLIKDYMWNELPK